MKTKLTKTPTALEIATTVQQQIDAACATATAAGHLDLAAFLRKLSSAVYWAAPSRDGAPVSQPLSDWA